MRKNILILKGNIIYTKTPEEFTVCEHSYLVCRDGSVDGIYRTLPFRLGGNPIRDFGDCLIIRDLRICMSTHLSIRSADSGWIRNFWTGWKRIHFRRKPGMKTWIMPDARTGSSQRT